VHVVKTIPAAVIGLVGLLLISAVSACGRSEPASSSAAASDTAAAVAAASSAEASASDAQASAAIAGASVPAAGTVANDKGFNQKTPPPSVNVAEQAQAAGDEAPQELRDKVNAAKDAGRAPKQ